MESETPALQSRGSNLLYGYFILDTVYRKEGIAVPPPIIQWVWRLLDELNRDR